MVSDERVPILGSKSRPPFPNPLNNPVWGSSPSATTTFSSSNTTSTTTTTTTNGTVPETSIVVSEDEKEKKEEDCAESECAAGNGSGKSWMSNLSGAKKATLALMCVSNISACACFSLLAPFFPAEASAKGMSEGTIGLVFSCYELSVFISSPIFGNYLVYIGHRFSYLSGQFVAGGCSILFGLLYLSPPGLPFTVLTFLLRSTMGIGASALYTSSFAIVAYEFPDDISVVFAFLEVFTGIGYMIGPLLGGALYELGGFGLPFFVTGSFLLLLNGVTYLLLPTIPTRVQQVSRKGSVVSLLASPMIVVTAFTLLTASYTFGFMDASLALHLEQFNLTAGVTGVFFMIVAAIYALTSPVFGWLSDKKNITYSLLVYGAILNIIALLFLGPSPLLPFLSPDLVLVVVALILTGIGVAATIIPIIKCFYIGARRLGFTDGMQLDGLLSGLFNSSLHLGTFLGPTIGSSVMQTSSYEWSITLNAGFILISLILLVAYKLVEKSCLKYEERDTDIMRRPSQNSTAAAILAPSLPSTSQRNENHYPTTTTTTKGPPYKVLSNRDPFSSSSSSSSSLSSSCSSSTEKVDEHQF